MHAFICHECSFYLAYRLYRLGCAEINACVQSGVFDPKSYDETNVWFRSTSAPNQNSINLGNTDLYWRLALEPFLSIKVSKDSREEYWSNTPLPQLPLHHVIVLEGKASQPAVLAVIDIPLDAMSFKAAMGGHLMGKAIPILAPGLRDLSYGRVSSVQSGSSIQSDGFLRLMLSLPFNRSATSGMGE